MSSSSYQSESPVWLVRASRFAEGFAMGILTGLVPALVWTWPLLERDGAGILVGCCALAVAVAIALLQWILAESSRLLAQTAHEEVMSNVNRETLGSHGEVFGKVCNVVASTSELASGCELRLGWPIHNLGNLRSETTGTAEHAKMRADLLATVSGGTLVRLTTLPLVTSDSTPLLDLFTNIDGAPTVRLQGTARSNLADELSLIVALLEAAETSSIHSKTQLSPLSLTWVKSPTVFWAYRILGETTIDKALLFTAGYGGSLLERGLEPTMACRGLSVASIAGSFMEEVSAAVESDQAIRLTETRELRLLRKAFERAHKRLESANDAPEGVLKELRAALFFAASLNQFTVDDGSGSRWSGNYYLWRAREATKRLVVVIPSAAGLYGDWRSTKSGGEAGGEIPKLRFSRYEVLCGKLRDRCDCDVALLSQTGQAGHGEWSPKRSWVEVQSMIEQMAEQYDAIALFGICTGGLAALEVLNRSLKSRRYRTGERELPLRGIAVWDLTASPGFDPENVEKARNRYELIVRGPSEFDASPYAATIALSIDRLLKSYSGGKRVWCGGVREHVGSLPASAQSWSAIEGFAQNFSGDSCELFGGGTVGHVPGKDNDTDFDKFIESVTEFLMRILGTRLALPPQVNSTEKSGTSPD